jgi:hypothetical protein
MMNWPFAKTGWGIVIAAIMVETIDTQTQSKRTGCHVITIQFCFCALRRVYDKRTTVMFFGKA